MKVKFSNSIPFTPTWNGNDQLPEEDQVKSVLRPMLFDDLMSFFDAIGGAKAAGELKTLAADGNVEELTNKLDFGKLIREVGNLVPKYATIENLEGLDGPLSAHDIVKYPMFMGLTIELLTKLADISSPSEDAEGNSEGQPA